MFETTMRPGVLVDAVNMCCPKIPLVDDKILEGLLVVHWWLYHIFFFVFVFFLSLNRVYIFGPLYGIGECYPVLGGSVLLSEVPSEVAGRHVRLTKVTGVLISSRRRIRIACRR